MIGCGREVGEGGGWRSAEEVVEATSIVSGNGGLGTGGGDGRRCWELRLGRMCCASLWYACVGCGCVGEEGGGRRSAEEAGEATFGAEGNGGFGAEEVAASGKLHLTGGRCSWRGVEVGEC